jgi:hypothetical protein
MKKIAQMSQIKFSYFLIFYFIFASNSFAEIKILKWYENSVLTEKGKKTEIFIKGKVQNITNNQVLTSFSIGFDPKQKIKIFKVLDDSTLDNFEKSARYKFLNNNLEIDFTQGIANQKTFSLYLNYQEDYQNINQFLRQEYIRVPRFAEGAEAKIVLNFPINYILTSFDKNLNQQNSSIIYQNIVPSSGVNEIVKLTPKENLWDVNLKISINSSEMLKKVSVKMPIFYQSPHQEIVENNLLIEPQQQSIKTDQQYKYLKFLTNSNQIIIKNKAKIKVVSDDHIFSNYQPSKNLEISESEKILLTPILNFINNDQEYKNLPQYVKIGKFVNKFIKYDENLVGKLLSIEEIISTQKGVCTEYAKLFNSLARLANIPSVIIEGGACGEYNKCQGHSWNMVYYQNKWIEVDPTWDLLSGVVSSSHIFINDYQKGTSEVTVHESKIIPSIKTEFEMKKIR